MIYLDNGATTFPKPGCVVQAVNRALREFGANPGRGGHKLAIRASEEIYKCRSSVAKLFHVENLENIIFTNNCTTALNTVIKGLLKPGDHVVVSCFEHNSVIRPLEKLQEMNITYTKAEVFPFDPSKTLDSFRQSINPNTRLVVCTHASNVFGVRLPIERICALCHQYDIPVCVDAAQTAGVLPIDMTENRIDYLCTAGHKGLYGPMGTGIMIINSENVPDSLTEGGTGSNSLMKSQPALLPDKFESGTPNLPGIAGLRAGVDFVMRRGAEKIFQHEMRLILRLYDKLQRIDGVKLYTGRPDKDHFVPVLSFNVQDKDSELISAYLNKNFGIAVRSGLHCAPVAHEFMHTLETGTVRVVPSMFTTENQIDTLVYAVSRLKNENLLKINK